jgi:acetyl esterase/lipase/glyoxylase-like metal-dependent hydrolase (beta-lactamase superfamily II)
MFAMFAIHVVPALAAAPMVKTQPGFYRMMLGDFEVTALNDGVVAYATTQVLPTATPEQIKNGLSELSLTDPVGMSYNAFLINTGSKLILIDTGTGGKLSDQPAFHAAGHLMANLRAAGYQPEQVDEIYVTHLGPEHVGGLTLGIERAFPNAILRAPKSEVDLFLHPDTAPVWTKSWTQFWAALFSPYIKAEKFQSFDSDITLTPGIRALATHGHAPSHTSYVVESKGQTLIVMGDLVLKGALQFANPSLGSAFDANTKLAAEQRQRIFKMATVNHYWVAGGHLSFPGIGHIQARQARYSWIPADYLVPEEPPIDKDAMHIPAIALPDSSFLNAEARAAIKKEGADEKEDDDAYEACGDIDHADANHAPEIRKCETEVFYRSSDYKRLYQKYPVKMNPQRIGGIYTEVFTPASGISPRNATRVLINLHGGGFVENARTESHIESVPIASIGQIRVISIDYRQAPEFAFPSASEDVAAVYRELLRTYKPKDIGIYGCSAGGLLTAESVAWLQKELLPLPGAVGMLCEGAGYWTEGDTGYVGKAMIGGTIWGNTTDNPYFKNTKSDDPLAFPIRSLSIMKQFPPSLLIAATRDPALSSVVQTHSVLVSQGVDAELHVWEGLGHAFFFDPDLPQSREVYAVTVKFFNEHLGR